MKWMRQHITLLIVITSLQTLLIGVFTISAFLYRANLEIFHSLELRWQELQPITTSWQVKNDLLQQVKYDWWLQQRQWGLAITVLISVSSYFIIWLFFKNNKKNLTKRFFIIVRLLASSFFTVFTVFYLIKSTLWQYLLTYCTDYYHLKLSSLTQSATGYLRMQQPRLLPFNIDSLTHVYISNPLNSKSLLLVVFIGTLYYLLLILLPVFLLTKLKRRRKKVPF
ncbi:hypothetical protein P7H56_07265 [Vagococcus lutrae]|uniref:hypothetical protein n=1 Tax=Vagococcus lutrae TaxID=81947 RepID=UPI00288EB451|nr:hypothetical protein [Vagococcus lutrae]MDT2802073.1 hypothetical protein [Vagococcus lutrae]MDT2823787.1 hypothetical protein [Vagococcus lutrae]MDT2826263.1 hypothetical protein [Vagococcus lutrae]